MVDAMMIGVEDETHDPSLDDLLVEPSSEDSRIPRLEMPRPRLTCSGVWPRSCLS